MRDDMITRSLLAGNTEALALVMDRYGKLLWLVIESVIGTAGTSEDIEECLSDVFLRLWKNPKGFDHKKGSLKTYLCIMAKSIALNRYKTLTRHSSLAENEAYGDSADDIAEVIWSKETYAALWEKVSSLNEPVREILIRRYFYGEKPAQIATEMQIDSKTVENKLYTSKRKLRTQLKEVGIL